MGRHGAQVCGPSVREHEFQDFQDQQGLHKDSGEPVSKMEGRNASFSQQQAMSEEEQKN